MIWSADDREKHNYILYQTNDHSVTFTKAIWLLYFFHFFEKKSLILKCGQKMPFILNIYKVLRYKIKLIRVVLMKISECLIIVIFKFVFLHPWFSNFVLRTAVNLLRVLFLNSVPHSRFYSLNPALLNVHTKRWPKTSYATYK